MTDKFKERELVLYGSQRAWEIVSPMVNNLGLMPDDEAYLFEMISSALRAVRDEAIEEAAWEITKIWRTPPNREPTAFELNYVSRSRALEVIRALKHSATPLEDSRHGKD